jgi:pseudolysin
LHEQRSKKSEPWALSISGMVYQDIAQDLKNKPLDYMSVQHQNMTFESVMQKMSVTDGMVLKHSINPIIYIDDRNVSHWAYLIELVMNVSRESKLPVIRKLVIDALQPRIYFTWNEVKTMQVDGGGYGGNEKTGLFNYDGAKGNLAKLSVVRDAQQCYLKNDNVIVKSEKSNQVLVYFCAAVDPLHNHVFWADALESVNGGYSPGIDALFAGAVIEDLYQQCCHVPVLQNSDGTKKRLVMMINADIDNAYWDGLQVVLGDGVDKFYPLTSLDVVTHEVSHGFTEQHSNLIYSGQPGGINESFSDIAGQAAEIYIHGGNDWMIGAGIMKEKNKALRYLFKPSVDCDGRLPGDWCSIDDARQYKKSLDVHFLSGVYNRFFYLWSHSPGWDVLKAFSVLVHANQFYWTSLSDYEIAACGVLQAAADFNYDPSEIVKSFHYVGIEAQACNR